MADTGHTTLAPEPEDEPTSEQFHSISELTREFGVSARTLRFYESEGMLSPDRRGQQRLYSQRERTRLKLILRGKRLGFSLADISEIIGMYDAAPGEAGQLRHLLARIEERRAELLQKQRDLENTLSDLDRVVEGCHARLRELDPGDYKAAR